MGKVKRNASKARTEPVNRTFKHFPDDVLCPVCHTDDDGECFLIPIDGTQEDNIVEAQPCHVLCITRSLDKLQYNKEYGLIYMRVKCA